MRQKESRRKNKVMNATQAAAKYRRGRRNIDTLHAASDREFTADNAAKYGHMPWGQFYHYVAMELAPLATRAQMDMAIAKALRLTEEQETGCRNSREARYV